jgi:hypothetical protein
MIHKFGKNLVIVVYIIYVFTGCTASNESSKIDSSDATRLLITNQSFPEGWQVISCEPHCERAERANIAYRGFGIADQPGHAIQTVTKFTSLQGAKSYFQRSVDSLMQVRKPPDITFTVPQTVTYQSIFTDDFRFGCGVHKISACMAVFRYDNYIVEMYIHLHNGEGGGLFIEAIPPILEDIDRQAANELSLSSLKSLR